MKDSKLTEYNNYFYNKTFFDGQYLYYTPKKRPREKSFKFWQLNDGTLVALFQGSKGDQKDIDFIVKFLIPGSAKHIRTPENMHWVTDLLIKHQRHPNEVREFIEFFNNWYRDAVTFASVEERNNYELKTPDFVNLNFGTIMHEGTLSIEYVGIIIELFTLNEKLSPRPNKMYEKLLKLFKSYCEGTKDYFQLISGSKAGF